MCLSLKFNRAHADDEQVKWRRGELNPCPHETLLKRLHAYLVLIIEQ